MVFILSKYKIRAKQSTICFLSNNLFCHMSVFGQCVRFRTFDTDFDYLFEISVNSKIRLIDNISFGANIKFRSNIVDKRE